MQRVPVGSEEPTLFRSVPHEERRARRWSLLECARDRQERHAHRRVVVRTIPDGIAGDRITYAVVILVAAEQHVLVSSSWIRTADAANDVHRRIAERLDDERRRESRIRTACRAT